MSEQIRTFNAVYKRQSDGKLFRVDLDIDVEQLMAKLAARVMVNRTGRAVLLDGIVTAKGTLLKGQS